jgi:zinc D-Ala-D-Ala carboxypeptidase
MTFYQSWKDVPKDKWRWPNFSPREIACKGTGTLLLEETAMDALQRLRDRLGRPLIIVSAYRSQKHNKNVGGAKNSFHMQGHAFDVRMDNHNPWEFELAAKAEGFRGFGYYAKSGFMHIDMRPNPTTWGAPFPNSATNLVVESIPRAPDADRETIAQSTTIQASAVQVASGVGTGVAALSSLDGNAQIALLVVAGVIIIAGIWIMRERIKKWSGGDR